MRIIAKKPIMVRLMEIQQKAECECDEIDRVILDAAEWRQLDKELIKTFGYEMSISNLSSCQLYGLNIQSEEHDYD